MPKEEVSIFDLLGASLSIEFNECSIAAAELNQQVGETLDVQGLRSQTLYAIGDDNMLGQRFVVKYLPYQARFEIDDFRLALIKPESGLTGRRAIMKRAIEKSIDVAGQEPQLVGILGAEDAYVPLATFARRDGGTCSYVQLGSEMRDDDLFVTTADESTSRHAIIETVRTLVATKGDEAVSAPPEVITDLLGAELTGKEKQLDKAKESQMVRLAFVRSRAFEPTRLWAFDEQTNEVSRQNAPMHTFLRGIELSDGRFINLALGQSGEDTLQLTAITRGDIAMPLAVLDKPTGEIDFGGLEGRLSPGQRRDVVSTLHHFFYYKNAGAAYTYEHKSNKQSTELVIARHLVRRGLLAPYYNRPNYRSDRDRANGIDKKEVRRRVDDFLADPIGPKPYASAALQEVLKQMHIFRQPANIIYNSLALEDRLRSALGPTSRAEELLFRRVRTMADKRQTFSAVADNCQMGKTTGAAELEMQISRVDMFYNVAISGKPKAQTGEALAPLPALSLAFESTQSIFDRQKMSDSEAANRAREILEILSLVKI